MPSYKYYFLLPSIIYHRSLSPYSLTYYLITLRYSPNPNSLLILLYAFQADMSLKQILVKSSTTMSLHERWAYFLYWSIMVELSCFVTRRIYLIRMGRTLKMHPVTSIFDLCRRPYTLRQQHRKKNCLPFYLRT